MISLTSFEEQARTLLADPTLAEIERECLPNSDAMLMRILDVAEYHDTQNAPDGSLVQLWKLTKRVGVFPAGSVVSLKHLHELVKN